ncbi:MAG: flagellar basal body L-ring protein FlgH [Gemmatimonas sp.]
MPRVAYTLRFSAPLLAASLLLIGAPLAAQTPPTTPPATPPAGAGAAAAATTASTATARPVRESWTSDRRNFAVGDLITVLIDDYTIATALKENTATDTRTRGLSASARLPTSSKNVGLDTRNSADQQQRGASRRENRFQNELSVRVMAIAPNGLLQLKGTKNINVDKSGQDIVFTGFARPQDISSSNMVESNRIADAQLGYLSPGPLGKPKQGLISKVLGAFWP